MAGEFLVRLSPELDGIDCLRPKPMLNKLYMEPEDWLQPRILFGAGIGPLQCVCLRLPPNCMLIDILFLGVVDPYERLDRFDDTLSIPDEIPIDFS